MTEIAQICLPFHPTSFGQFSVMTSSLSSRVCGAVMQARSNDDRHQTLSFYRVFKWKEEPWRPAVISPEYCLIGSTASRWETCWCVHVNG